MVLGGATGYPLRIFRNDGGKALRYQENLAFEDDDLAEDLSILPFDFDRDGDLDLWVASGGVELDEGDEYYADRLYLNSGDMRFGSASWRGPEAASSASLMLNGDLALVAGGSISGSYPRAEPNSVYRWTAGRLEPVDHAFSSSGRTSRLVAADFDGDGRLDIALGNLGQNNKYEASPEQPAVLFAPKTPELHGKFIEADAIGGKEYPRESRIFHQVDFPDIAERTGSYADFARMTVEEAFGTELLAQYDRFAFDERRSVLLTQDKAGGFSLSPFSGLVQSGAAIDLLAADVDEDGDADLVLVLASISPQPAAAIHPETSFLLCLINEGQATFRALLPHESGLVLQSGEARRLAWADLDGDGRSELIVSASEGPLAVFAMND